MEKNQMGERYLCSAQVERLFWGLMVVGIWLQQVVVQSRLCCCSCSGIPKNSASHSTPSSPSPPKAKSHCPSRLGSRRAQSINNLASSSGSTFLKGLWPMASLLRHSHHNSSLGILLSAQTCGRWPMIHSNTENPTIILLYIHTQIHGSRWKCKLLISSANDQRCHSLIRYLLKKSMVLCLTTLHFIRSMYVCRHDF